MKTTLFKTPISKALMLALLPLALLQGCGGSSSGADVTQNAPAQNGGQSSNYSGPAAQTADINAFKVNVWDNLARADRCGNCHVQSQQAPSFARNDDINLAYTAANSVITLSNPGSSEMVSKVRGGHQCWLETADACAAQLTTWITNWANASIGGDAGEVDFQPPPLRDPGASRYYPDSSALFAANVHPLFRNFCVECHEPNAVTPITPYFAHANADTAYLAAQGVMNLNVPANSRVVQRLAEDNHNCWTDDCDSDAAAMAQKIADMAAGITPATPPDDLVISKALVTADGIIAASGGRFDSNVIGRYEFRSGSGNVAFDTSPVTPAADLNLVGDVEWVAGWGIRVNDGKAQATTTNSRKYYQLIQSSGEFSVEAWIIPSTPAQNVAHIVSYSAGTTARNFTLAQSDSRYSFALRHSNTSLNGEPAIDSPDETLQASLQHVVLTYDLENGRRIFINGEDSGTIDPNTPDLLNSWNDTYALVLGNEASSDRLWQGVIRFVAIHNRALSPSQVLQNFSAGVGERRYLLFGISHLIPEDDAFIGFQVSRFDDFSYLFAEPFFIDLTEGQETAPAEIPIAGMRLGINGGEAAVAQVWANLDTTIGGDSYVSTGQQFSRLGTLLAVDQDEQQDEFFLTFARLGNNQHTYTDAASTPLVLTAGPTQETTGIRTFDEINASMSAMTGVPATYGDVPDTFQTIRKQLPTSAELGGFLTAHQIAIAQLSIEYCNAMIEADIANDSDVPVFFSGLNYNTNANTLTDTEWRDLVITPLVDSFVGTGLDLQPSPNAVTCELETLLFDSTAGSAACSAAPSTRPTTASLARCGGSCSSDRTAIAAKAACAVALGSATMLLQ